MLALCQRYFDGRLGSGDRPYFSRGRVGIGTISRADCPSDRYAPMATTASKALSEPTQTKPVPSAKRRTRVRPAVRVPEAVALTPFDSRWERRAERRAGRGLFFFGRFAGAE